MSINNRLRALERQLSASIHASGICSVCREKHISLHYNEPIPEPCRVCGMIAQSIIFFSDRSAKTQCKPPDAIAGRYKSMFCLPGKGR